MSWHLDCDARLYQKWACGNAQVPGDDAPVVWGTCGHAFHLQCINKCLATQEEQRCPFCRRPWEFKVPSAHKRQTSDMLFWVVLVHSLSSARNDS